MTKIMLPPNRPNITRERVEEIITQHRVNRAVYPLVIVGIRGYYEDTMGVKNRNDRGVYDDAICLLTDREFAAFNANTDPSRYGLNPKIGKGLAVLQAGVYYAYRFDTHGGSQPHAAICQRAGAVKVLRDGTPPTLETSASLGINIHRGSINSTSSEGCQTIPPPQWGDFYVLAEREARRLFGKHWKQQIIPYVLVEQA